MGLQIIQLKVLVWCKNWWKFQACTYLPWTLSYGPSKSENWMCVEDPFLQIRFLSKQILSKLMFYVLSKNH